MRGWGVDEFDALRPKADTGGESQWKPSGTQQIPGISETEQLLGGHVRHRMQQCRGTSNGQQTTGKSAGAG